MARPTCSWRSSQKPAAYRDGPTRLLQRVRFHYTPKHASWLNMAEIEIGILTRQCLGRRIIDRDALAREIDAWQHERNARRKKIEWRFTQQDADYKMARHYLA